MGIDPLQQRYFGIVFSEILMKVKTVLDLDMQNSTLLIT